MKLKKRILRMILAALCLMVWLPLILLAAASFMPEDEILYRYLAPLGQGRGPVRAALLPQYPTWEAFRELLFRSPGFFVMFWNSCIQVFPMLAGQLLVGTPAAWAFARYSFPGRRALFFLYVLLMILPFQITQVSNYLVLDRLALLNSHLSMILPGIWATMPVFIMERFFETIPDSLLEAACLDGAGACSVFWKVGIPLGIPGIVTAFMLGFFDGWNALEQPLAYLKDPSLWPLSLYLPEITADKASVAFAASIIMLIPSALLYLNGQEYLEQGVAASGVKE